MSEPLFLNSVMQEKIWGGTKLRDEFGYDIPSEKSENIGPSQPSKLVSLKCQWLLRGNRSCYFICRAP